MLFTFQFLSLYLYPQPLAYLYYRYHGHLSTLLYVLVHGIIDAGFFFFLNKFQGHFFCDVACRSTVI